MPLMRARLAMSLCYSAHNRARNPGDAYQTISEAAVLKLLEILSQDTAQAAFEAVRGACAEAPTR